MTLRATDLTIGYGRLEVGSDIDVALTRGDILCLLGPNACGKTTLFRTLLGLIPPLAGRVELADTSITALARAEIARHVAYVPQAHAPTFPFEALEVVLMGRTARLKRFGQPGRADRETAMDALTRLGIADLARRDYSRLSGGQRQLVLIARALAQETAFVVLDEPTASLDFSNKALVLGEIAALARDARHAGQGIVMSTHDPDQAFALDARVLLMKDGRTYASGSTADTLTSGNLTAVFDLPIAVERTASGHTVCVPSGGGREIGWGLR